MKTVDQLRELVAFADSVEDDDELRWAGAFRDMLSKFENGIIETFSKAQRTYVADVYEKVTGEVTYENAWSAGKIPRGAISTPVPDVLLKPLPMKPPGRR